MGISSRLIRAIVELICLILFILDLLLFKRWIFAGVVLAYFIYDFLKYRREALFNYRESRSLREGMTLSDIRSIERKYSLREDFNSFEKHAEKRTPLDRYFYFAKYEQLRDLLHAYGKKGDFWLDLGCGFGEDAFYIAQHFSQGVIGLELDEIKLFQARKKLQGMEDLSDVDFVAGDAICLPFRSQVFDTILMTEVLEHLIDPEEGIKSCRYLLKEGGILVISTPSLHNMNYKLNPLFLLEKAISLLDDNVLPLHHGLHARFEYNWKRPEPEYGIHHHFSHQQLKRMVTQNHFHILWEGTFEIEIFPYLFVEFFSRGRVRRIRKVIEPIEKVLERIPFVNRFGQHLLLVAQKSFN